MNEDVLKHGAFSWSELMTSDPEGAKKFYTELFGWKTEDLPMEGMTYTAVKIGGDAVGGIMPMAPGTEGMHPAWGVYVTVDNVDDTAGRVAELGGKILHPPTDIPDVGRFCVLSDPQGAVIHAITYAKK